MFPTRVNNETAYEFKMNIYIYINIRLKTAVYSSLTPAAPNNFIISVQSI